jgi:broad specificity phosphatase PhoE
MSTSEYPHRREFLHPHPFLDITFVRHGEQESYGQQYSHLTKRGCEQISTFIEELLSSYKNNEHVRKIKIFYSTRQRTRESAQIIIDKSLQSMFSDPKYIQSVEWTSYEELQTADALLQLIKNGVDPHNAYRTWLTQNTEQLNALQSESPEQMGERLINIIFNIHKKVQLEWSSQKWLSNHYIMVTHETSLAALIRTLKLPEDTNIKHAESLSVRFLMDGGQAVWSFRGKQYNSTIPFS